MKTSVLFLICFSLTSIISFSQPQAEKFETIRSFKTNEVHQGVAVDKKFFYSVNTKGIGKYDKKSGEFISEWKDAFNQIIHLDGGVVVNDKLYCAHSNFPGIPMTSSIEVFNKNTLEYIDSFSFGIKYGSCTWADYYNKSWWVCFSHYDRFVSETNTDSRWTVLVNFDRNWNELESWVFPETVLSELKPMGCSGGSWGPDGNLYVTGHDSTKVYVLQLPETGSVLQYINTLKVDFNGQGIAWDRSDKNYLYGIIRKKDTVVKSKLLFQ
jgi:hypothetical protein